MQTKETGIAKAIRLAKGQVALCEKLKRHGVDVTQQAISLWHCAGYAPRKQHSAISRAVSRRVSIRELEQDILVAQKES